MSEQDRETKTPGLGGRDATLTSASIVERVDDTGTRKKSLRHELRTPLNQIIGYSEMLQEEAEERSIDGFIDDLKKIEKAARHMVDLVDLVKEPEEAAPRLPHSIRVSQVPATGDRLSFEPPAMASLAEAFDTGPGVILVVDDNEANRDILARRLRRNGYEVRTAEGGQEAIDAIAAAPVDLLLLDVMMPGISGFEVLQILRGSYSVADLPVIMATALDASEDVVKALKLGANDYVTKPLDLAIVLARVSTQLGLKRAKEKVQQLNDRLEHAQSRISKLVESSAEAMNDVASWAVAVAQEVSRAIGADEVAVWVFEDENVSSLTMTQGMAPGFDDVRTSARAGRYMQRGNATVIPVTGMSGEVYGALVVRGLHLSSGDLESKVLASFSHQLGGALELQRMRKELAAAAERKRVSRRDMLARGVDLLRICPACLYCYDQTVAQCPRDGVTLPDPSSVPYRVAGRHRLLRVLGEGGMGTVFSAQDERLEREVAVKIIKAEHFNNDTVRIRFEHEAKAVARIDHPGVVSVFDSGELQDGSLFIVMEMLHGRDMSDLVKSCGRGTPAQVAELLRQAGAALAAAHRVRLVHRDIKPENIFLSPQAGGFRAKILDFGVAKEVSTDHGLTQTGTLIGTPLFMSPEQILGKNTDTRSDIYSFAAVAYLALSGRRVTLGETLPEILLDVVQNDPPALSSLVPNLPPLVDAAFTAALAKSPEDRPDNIDDWVAGFVDALASVPSDTPGWLTAEGLLDLEVRDPSKRATVHGNVRRPR